MAPYLSEFGLTWLEEPLRTNRPAHEWQALAAMCVMPLAAGENIMGEDDFNDVSRQSSIAVVQPDVAKWGGISGCWPVIQAIQASGKLYCPHYLGAGIGLLASAHLLAATGGQGMLEIDANPNPLRSGLAGVLSELMNGTADLHEAPGVGVPSLLAQDLLPFLVSHSSIH
jgi:L-alanine-DL-glutamate epimerase-like enolase superfamily enzyme